MSMSSYQSLAPQARAALVVHNINWICNFEKHRISLGSRRLSMHIRPQSSLLARVNLYGVGKL